MEITTDLLKHILTIAPALLSAVAASYMISNLFATLKKTRQIEKKLSAEEHQLVFDPGSGEFVVSKTKQKAEHSAAEQISKDGFAGSHEHKIKIDTKHVERPKSDGYDSKQDQAYNLRHFGLIENYYSQALNQSKISFWFSLAGASIGFFVIILSVVLYQDDRNGVALFSLISGVVIEGVSALFFTQTNRDQKRRSEFFENLRKDKLYKESIALCDSVSDTKAKDALKIQIALSFAGISDSTQVAKTIIQENLTTDGK